MANARRQNSRSQRGAGRAGAPSPAALPRGAAPVQTGRATSRKGTSGWLRWGAGLALVAALVSLFATRLLPALGTDEGAGPRPIASLDAPDAHSLLVDPKDPDHLLFGAHSGLQASRDGGFTWETGTLRDADAMSLATSPKEPATLYAVGHDVFQVSRDGGRTWQPVEHDLPSTDLHAFAQDPNDPRRLYALVAGAGLFASSDGGAAWTPLAAQPPGGGMHIALATDGSTLYAATEAGLVLSRDQGAAWQASPAQPDNGVLSLAIPASEPQTIYAGTTSGLAKSSDGGATWTSLGPDDVPAVALAVASTDPNRVVIVDDDGAVYRSDDGGASWVEPR